MSREKQNLPRRRMLPARRCSKWPVLSTPLPRPKISEMQEVPSGRKHRITSQILQNLHYASLCRYSRLLKFVPVGTGNRWKQSTKDKKSISNEFYEFKCTWCHGMSRHSRKRRGVHRSVAVCPDPVLSVRPPTSDMPKPAPAMFSRFCGMIFWILFEFLNRKLFCFAKSLGTDLLFLPFVGGFSFCSVHIPLALVG